MKPDPIREPARLAAELIDRLSRLVRLGAAGVGLNPVHRAALSYLSRANRFSRTPAALATFLGSTRGTVSQTLNALERKELVRRSASPRDGRSVDLVLTSRGEAALRGDPLGDLADDIARATSDGGATIAGELGDVLRAAIARNGGRAFGACRDCRHFRARGASGASHHCMLLDEPLDDRDSAAICVEQEPVVSAST